MKAIVIKNPGPPDVLQLSEVAKPEPGKGEVLIKVKAVGVNRADCVQRQGRYPAPKDCPQNIPGLEYAGIIEDANGSDFQKGDKVFGLVGGGSYAEYLVAHSRAVSVFPENLSFVEAAALPEAFVTAYDAMVSQGNLESGQRVLINAAGSGVGIAAMQIAEALGATYAGTVRSASKAEKLHDYKNIIVAPDGKISDKVLEIFPTGVDLVVELVGGDYINEDLICLAPKGRIILIGLLAGNKTEINLGMVLSKRATIRGTTMRARPLEEKIQAAILLQKNITPLFESNKLKGFIDHVLPLKEAAKAHEIMEANQNLGKIVLELS
ncbi:MAG: NAD(P)H-quinone oxidoreductase [Candidatus Melainabacteria bacterium]|nr:MAG: NAD(P)H-quinone oxidoreductase [Candidatus Melainabacteria bacterium]